MVSQSRWTRCKRETAAPREPGSAGGGVGSFLSATGLLRWSPFGASVSPDERAERLGRDGGSGRDRSDAASCEGSLESPSRAHPGTASVRRGSASDLSQDFDDRSGVGVYFINQTNEDLHAHERAPGAS